MPRFSCPSCQKALKVRVEVPAGKKIKCPGCGHVFRLSAPEEAIEELVAAPVGGPRQAQVSPARKAVKQAPAADEPDSEDRPAPRKSKKKAGKNNNRVLILAGAGAIVVLLAVTAFIWPGFLMGNTGKGKALASAAKTGRGQRQARAPKKTENSEEAPEELPKPQLAKNTASPKEGDEAAKPNPVSADGNAADAPSVHDIMVKLMRGPRALQNQIGKELKSAMPAWDTLGPQTTEYVSLASALGKAEPRKGSKESWAKQTADFAASATSLNAAVQSKNRDAALAAHMSLTRACMGCHQQHKGR